MGVQSFFQKTHIIHLHMVRQFGPSSWPQDQSSVALLPSVWAYGLAGSAGLRWYTSHCHHPAHCQVTPTHRHISLRAVRAWKLWSSSFGTCRFRHVFAYFPQASAPQQAVQLVWNTRDAPYEVLYDSSRSTGFFLWWSHAKLKISAIFNFCVIALLFTKLE